MSHSSSHAIALPRHQAPLLDASAIPQASDRLITRTFTWGFIASFGLRTNLYLLSVIMTAYCMSRYGCDISCASVATGIFTIGCLAARFCGGPVTDRLGLKATTLLGMGLTCAASFLYVVAGSIEAVIAIRLMHGLVYGVASTTVTSIASVNIPEKRHGEGMGYFMLSVTLASAVGPLAGIALNSGSTGNLLFYLAGATAAAAFLAVILAGPLTPQESAEGQALEDVTSLEPAAPSVEFDHAAIRLVPTPPSLKRCLEFSVFPIGSLAFVSYLVYGSVSAYLDPFAQQAHLMGAAGLFFVVYAAAMLISRPFTAKILDRQGPTLLIVPGFIALGAGIFLMGLSTNGIELLAAAALIGYGLGAIQPTGLALSTQYLGRSRYTVANATFYMMTDLACGISPIIFGFVVPVLGYRGLFCSLLALSAAGIAGYIVLHRAHRV